MLGFILGLLVTIFDIFEYLKNTFSKSAAGLGLIIMAVGGFAKYMEHIGASSTLVYYAIKPLLPLIFILVFSSFVIESIKMNVITAILISIFISTVFEVIRYKDTKKVFASI